MKTLRVFQRVNETGEVQVDLIPVHRIDSLRCTYIPRKESGDNEKVEKTNENNLNKTLSIITHSGTEYYIDCNGSERFTIYDENEKEYFSGNSLEELSFKFVKHSLRQEEADTAHVSKAHT